MQAKNKKNNSNQIHVTRENLFIGLSFSERVNSCIELVEGWTHQFLNETAIMLDMARNGASVYVACEAENDTDICAFLAQLDIEVQDIAKQTQEKLKNLSERSM